MLNNSKIVDGLVCVCAGLAVVAVICLAAMAYSLALIIYDQPFPDGHRFLYEHLNLHAVLWVIGIITAVLTWVYIGARRTRKVLREESEQVAGAEQAVVRHENTTGWEYPLRPNWLSTGFSAAPAVSQSSHPKPHRTALANQIRSIATEYSLTFPQSLHQQRIQLPHSQERMATITSLMSPRRCSQH